MYIPLAHINMPMPLASLPLLEIWNQLNSFTHGMIIWSWFYFPRSWCLLSCITYPDTPLCIKYQKQGLGLGCLQLAYYLEVPDIVVRLKTLVAFSSHLSDLTGMKLSSCVSVESSHGHSPGQWHGEEGSSALPPRLSTELQGGWEYLRLLSILIGLFVQMLWAASTVLSNQCMKCPGQHCLSIKVQSPAHFLEEIIPMVHRGDSVPGFESETRKADFFAFLSFSACKEQQGTGSRLSGLLTGFFLTQWAFSQIDCAEFCWDDYRKHESLYGLHWFSGPVFNLAQRTCDQSIASADHACSLGQKNVALQTTLMNNHSQSWCRRGKCDHQWGVWRSWRWTWVAMGDPCLSVLAALVLSPWGHTDTWARHLHMSTHCHTYWVSVCPEAPNKLWSPIGQPCLLAAWCLVRLAHGIFLLFLPPRGSGKPLAFHVESALGPCLLGSHLCPTPHIYRTPDQCHYVCSILSLYRYLGCCISGPCACLSTSLNGKPCLAIACE